MQPAILETLQQLFEQGFELYLKDGQLAFKADKQLLSSDNMAFLKANKAAIIDYLNTQPLAFTGLPLTHGQQGIFFAQSFQKDSPHFNLCSCVALKKHLQTAELKAALDKLLQAQPMLGAAFILANNHLKQIPSFHNTIELQQLDCTEAELQNVLHTQSSQAFALDSDCLIKALLISTEQGQHLAFIAHHLVADFWGLQQALQQLQLLLSQAQNTIEPIDYKQLVLQESQFLTTAAGDNAKAYWQSQLKKLPDAIELAGTGFGDLTKNVTGAEHLFSLDKSLSLAIKERAQQQGMRSYHLLLTSFALLLFKLSNSPALSLGIAVANRSNTKRQQSAGHFSQVLPLICQRQEAQSLSQWLKALQQDSNLLIAHQQYPAELLQQQISSELYRHAFSFNQTNPEMFSEGSVFQSQTALFQQGASLDLTLSILDDGEQFHASFRYKTDKFTLETIQRFQEYFVSIAEHCANSDCNNLLAVDYRSQQEVTLANNAQGTETALPEATNLAAVFAKKVQAQPEAIALISADKNYSYQQLDNRANDYADFLTQQGISAGDNIAIGYPRGFEFLAAVLGALKIGASYSAIDPSYPTQRAAFMQKESASRMLLSTEAQGVSPETVTTTKQTFNALNIEATDTACVLFTSGSTGTPKAVALSHQALMRLAFNNDFFAPKPQERCSFLANTAFDAINIEIWPCLLHGATLLQIDHDILLSPAKFSAYIKAQQLNHIMITTALFNSFIDVDPGMFAALKTVMIGGEAASNKHINQCLAQGAPQNLWNLYGPTENGSVSTAFQIKQRPSNEPVAIGKAIAHSSAFVIDRDGMPCLNHVAGELYVGGKGLANGYLNQPELNAEVFQTASFANNQRVYKTGDSVYLADDGYLYYQGRLDSQVKINGFRIELGEVEAALQSIAGVQQALALVQRPQQLVAYYQSEKALDNAVLLAELSRQLPSFAVPKKLQWLPALPITANGKIDKQQLPEISFSTGENLAAKTATEQSLLNIWQQIFQHENFGCDDNFFTLGGHSLLAVKMLGAIETQLQLSLSIADIFQNPSIKQLAHFIDNGHELTVLPAIAAIEHEPLIAAAISQQRLWFVQQLQSDTNVYNMPLALKFNAYLSANNLEQALATLQSRHDALTLNFIDNNGKAFMAVSTAPVTVSQYDLSAAADSHNQAQAIVDEFANQAFNLEQAPLIKALLIQLPNAQSLVAFCLHHIIADGWSMNILLHELSVLLEQQHLPKASGIGFRDYSQWQHNLLQGDYLEKQIHFWQQQLEAAEPFLELPLDYPRPTELTNEGAVEYFQLTTEQAENFRALCQKLNSSSFMVAMAAYHFLLSRYCNSQDLCVGFPSANREQPQSQNLVGLLVNNLVLRHQYQASGSVADFIAQIQEQALQCLAHQQLSFDQIIEALSIKPASNYTPFLQASFSLEENPLTEHIKQSFNGSCELWPLNWQVAKYDIHLSLFDDGQNIITGQIEYNKALFKPQSIAQIAKHFLAVLDVFADNINSPISQLNFLSEQEKAHQLYALNNTEYNHPYCENLSSLFLKQAEKTPNNTAVSDHQTTLSYQQLEQQANQLAHYLLQQGVNEHSHVAVCLERSVNVSIALLAILKTGACYVPILSSTPKERLAYILQDTQAALVISQQSIVLENINCPVLNIDDEPFLQNVNNQSIEAPKAKTGHGLFNIIYTSGSTGTPKGVMVGHNAIANRLLWMQRQYPLTEADVVLQKTPVNFDVSVWELFWPLLNGAAIFYAKPEGHYDSDYLAATIEQQNISCCHFVPSMLAVFIQNPAITQCTNLRQVFTSGEALQISHSEGFLALLPQCRLHNLYGPTEAAIDVSYYDCQNPEPNSSVPIGKPIDNTQLVVLNPHLSLLPRGAIGELYIGGTNLAQGYLNRPELTTQSFINNPFFNERFNSPKLYKTGDIVRLLADGNIEYLGRADHQVKIRGQRIELQDVEQQLLAIDAISEAVVICQEQRLLAFVVAKDAIDEATIKQQLGAHLAHYMLPDAIGFLEAMPLSSNGKLDRKALPVASLSNKQQAFVAPRNETEQQLQQLFEQLLQQEPIGIDDNFFELGGHSLLATQLASLIRQQFQCELALKTIFEQPSIRLLGDSLLSQSLEDLDMDDADLEALLNELGDD